jgi:hypothetical protein
LTGALRRQKPGPDSRRQAASRIGRQETGEGTAGRYPGERSLEDGDAQAAPDQVARDQGGEGAVGAEIGAQQGAGEPYRRFLQDEAEEVRGNVDGGDRVADERQRRRDLFDPGRVDRERQMTHLPT